jgi:insulysin
VLKTEAYKRKGEFLFLLINPNRSEIPSLIEEWARFTYEDFYTMRREWLKAFKTEWQISGHLTEESALTLVTEWEELIKDKKEEIQTLKNYIKLNPHIVNEYSIVHPHEDNQNSTAVCYFQSDSDTEDLKSNALNSVLFAMLRQVAYNTLRTQEQLGYIVFWSSFNIHTILGGAITVHSPKKEPEFLVHRINAFLESQKERINNLTEEEFEKFRSSEIAKETVKDVTLAEMSNRAWEEIYDQFYMFDRQEKQISALKEITREELIEYFNALFWKECRRINLKVICKQHKEMIDAANLETNYKWYSDHDLNVNIIDPEDIKKFQKSQKLL